ncbi:hypothetical protein HCN44_001830 [Aphidius gifuensis]|uniref:Proto-oncogene tyrosine-protein kinase receptor Ret n=1 Tax=Aphidius gifuensis TaxID=684658 RepID=A0A835CWA7_APHGI|nr:hypothetical protein HCN44_001830 [Aphidius gifuensis]
MIQLRVQMYLVFTLAITSASGIYFSQSDLTVRLPYWKNNNANKNWNNLSIFIPKILNDTSVVSINLTYKIVSTSDEDLVTIDKHTGEIIINYISKNETKLIIQANQINDKKNTATMELNIQKILIDNNCDDLTRDLCFWKNSKYKIYENQNENLLGNIGSHVYKTLCPNYKVTHYELLNATDYFYILNNGEFYANAMLDRDSQYPGPNIDIEIRCLVYDETTGQQFIHQNNINVDILDIDDNPPIAQTNTTITIHLKDFTTGDRLDDNELILKDADSTSSNVYNVKILEDVDDALDITFSTMAVEHSIITEPPSTLIFARIYSKTTLLPKSPYKVILQATDETLAPGKGEKTVNITLLFVGPQHHQTTTTIKSLTSKKTAVLFNNYNIYLSKFASKLYRVTQPDINSHLNPVFNIQNSKIFGITTKTGIVYKILSTEIIINIINTTNDTCSLDVSEQHTCANVVTKKSCETRCGIGSGVFSKNNITLNCAWRGKNITSKGPTSRYETCSPNLKYCPDSICDELEKLDPRICPQDCTTMEPSFGQLKKDKIGLKDGFEICRCDDEAYCSCGPLSLHAIDNSNEIIDSKYSSKNNLINNNNSNKGNRRDDRNKVSAIPSGECGSSCIIGIVCTSLFTVCVVGSFVTWKYRNSSKTRREFKRQTDDINNTLGILPLDYLERNDNERDDDTGAADHHRIIGLESFINGNINILLPNKYLTPDSKWEFPRSQLTIEQVLGEGEFGRVLKAKAIDICDWPGATTVAVKTLKEDASNSELADLLSEYQLLKQVQHPNVIKLFGACTMPGGPVYLIIEFAEFGSLRNYLRQTRHLDGIETSVLSHKILLDDNQAAYQDVMLNNKINSHDILSFAWQISKGMSYLTDIKLVHRDLAARNVLLAKCGSDKVCKISDFGLTRDIYEDDAYLKRSKGRVPVKWMAPESLADHIYTSKSDVWSFGVLLWELVTLGASPYPGVDVHNLYSLLKNGYRMEKPHNCSHQLYKIMVSCWHDEPYMRPSFKHLISQWEHMLEDDIEYLDLNPTTVDNQAYFSSLYALDSPISSSNETSDSGIQNNIQNKSVNYHDESTGDCIKKCEKIDKLQGLWQEASSSLFNPLENNQLSIKNKTAIYINEQLDSNSNLNDNYYEKPIGVRRVSIISTNENNKSTIMTINDSNNDDDDDENNQSQSYIDMEKNKKFNEQADLLLLLNKIDNTSDN